MKTILVARGHKWFVFVGVLSLLGCSSGPNAEDQFTKLAAEKEQKLKSLSGGTSRIENVQPEVQKTDSSESPYKGTLSFNKVYEVDASRIGGGLIRSVLGWKAHYEYRHGRWVLKSVEREVEDASGRRSWQEPDTTGAVPGDADVYGILSGKPSA